MRLFTLSFFILSFGLISCTSPDSTEAPYDRNQDSLRYDNEEHIRNIRQLTFGADNAEAYFGFGDEKIVFQSNNPDWGVGCDQIFYMDTSDKEENYMPKMISTGTGRTTCAFFLPGDTTFVYGSTHLDDVSCPEVPERGPNGAYVWPIYAVMHNTKPSTCPPNCVWKRQIQDTLNWFQALLLQSPGALIRIYESSQHYNTGTKVVLGTDASPPDLGHGFRSMV